MRRPALAAAAVMVLSSISTVALAAPAATEDIRDIRGPLTLVPWWRWPLVAAVALVVIAAVALGIRAYRARKLRALSPLDRARQALTKAEAYAREGRSRDWADLVAETSRGALAAKLGAQVLPQTTPELAAAMQSPVSHLVTIEPRDVTELLVLLESCDLARFAKASLDPGALSTATDTARLLVERLYAPAVKPGPVARRRPPPSTQQVTT